jgi:low affinity Fe/Cu permease
VRRPVVDSSTSRLLHALQSWSARAATSGVAILVSVVALAWALAARNAEPVLAWFEALASAVTLVMVFVLQHTQTRQQVALQHKLDEILRALPEADSGLIALESKSGETLQEVERRHSELRADEVS